MRLIKLGALLTLLITFFVLVARCSSAASSASRASSTSNTSPPLVADEPTGLQGVLDGIDTANSLAALSRVKREKDDVDGSCWAKNKKTSSVRTGFHLYYSCTDLKSGLMRMVFSYSGDDWLFVEKIIIKTDYNRYFVDPEPFKVERDNSGGMVWEWYDVKVENSDIPMIRDMAKSKNVTIRFEGKNYFKNAPLGKSDKSAIRDVLISYADFMQT